SAFVLLSALPLTPHGKLDRRALPAPDSPARTQPMVAPRTEVEELLAGLWAGVLGLKQVGIDDDFFALGGHSLRPTQLIARRRAGVARHQALRTTFRLVDRQPVQVVAPPAPLPLPLLDLQMLPADEREDTARQLAQAEAQRPFDLTRGPLLRLALLRLAPQQ